MLTKNDVDRGMATKCEVCKAKPGQPCVSLCDGKPLALRPIHLGRVELVR